MRELSLIKNSFCKTIFLFKYRQSTIKRSIICRLFRDSRRFIRLKTIVGIKEWSY